MPHINASTGLAGLLVVDKPLGWTSMGVVRRVRRSAGGTKTGHAGTLDPLATGVVICCLGRATRMVEQLMDLTKVYEARADLSAITASGDKESAVEPVAVAQPPDEAAIRSMLASRFVGHVQQKPPIHSAVHVDGQRAYQLARKGQSVTLAARTVRIDSIDLLEYNWPMLDLRITCSRGTYIRSLVPDLGAALGTGGHLASLRRLSVGAFDLSVTVDDKRLESPITQADLIPTSAIGDTLGA